MLCSPFKGTSKARVRTSPQTSRRVFRLNLLEVLEPRYALTAPVAQADLYYMHAADAQNPTPSLLITAPGVLANDTDAEDSLTANLINDVVNGDLTLNPDGSFSYTPQPGFTSDFFSYAAFDGNTPTNSCTDCIAAVTINIGNSNPVAVPDTLIVPKNTTTVINVLANDTDNENDVLQVALIQGNPAVVGMPVAITNGSVTLNADHTISFTPDTGYIGPANFSYNAGDGDYGGVSATIATVNLVVGPLADAGSGYFMQEGNSLALNGTNSVGATSYAWYIEPIPSGANPATFNYSDPPDDALPITGLNPVVSWAQLNAWGITGATPSAVVTLRATTGTQVSYAQTSLNVSDVAPLIQSFTVTPATGECAGTGVTMEATIFVANPLERSNLSVGIDWNWDLLGGEGLPVADEVVTVVNNLDGSQTVSSTHPYAAAGFYYPQLIVNQLDALSDVTAGGIENPTYPLSILGPVFIEVSGTSTSSGVTNVAITGASSPIPEGTQLVLGNAFVGGCGTHAFEWSVVKYGAPTPFLIGENSTLDFTPTDNGSYAVSLKVDGVPAPVQTITVTNVAPSNLVATFSQPVAGSPDVTLKISSFVDPGTADTFTLNIVWGPNDTQDLTLSPNSLPITLAHTYRATGTKSVLVTLADDDGGEAEFLANAIVNVALSDTGTLAVQGAATADDVTITSPSAGIVQVQGSLLGSPLTFPASAVSLLKVDLGNGDDSLLVGAGITTTVLAFGGSGNDVLVGGSGSNVFVGGAGADILTGRGARDILIGGDGSDVLSGAGGQDILVDGATTYDTNEEALLALLAEWTSGDDSSTSFQRRVRHLSGLEPGGLNGSYLLIPLNNSTLDLLFGGAGNDWIIRHSGDINFG